MSLGVVGSAVDLPPAILNELGNLVRGGAGDDVASYLDTLCTETSVAGTRTRVCWHRLTHDATLNQPNVAKLVAKLLKLLIDFACTRAESEAAAAQYAKTRSGESFSTLQEKARSLFTTQKKTGEVGEILLYYLAERLLKYPQVLCKMPLKTNPEMHAHGADGVHASVHPQTKHLRLHWGEAKLYEKLSKALDDCFESLSDLLLAPADAKKTKTRDIELLRDYIDLANPEFEAAIRGYLDPDNRLSNNVEFCGLALVGFDLKDYEAFSKAFANNETAAIAARTTEWSTRLKKAVEKHELIGITIDAFCIPFASVKELRAEFLKSLGVACP